MSTSRLSGFGVRRVLLAVVLAASVLVLAPGAGPGVGAAEDLPECEVAPFVDVPVGHPFCAEIRWMVDAGVTTGYSDGRFGPGDVVKRQAMAAFLARVEGPEVLPGCAVAPFSDVSVGHPFCAEIRRMVDAGLTTGYSDGRFGPNDVVKRQAMAAFLARLDAPVTSTSYDCTQSEVSVLECEALYDVYDAAPTGWDVSHEGWGDGDPCAWMAIECSEGHVQSLQVYSNDSMVELPESLGNLLNLAELNIAGNDVLLELPDSLGDLSSLQTLSVDYNSSLADLPESLGDLSSLESLDVLYNSSLASLPESLGSLSNLQALDVRVNDSLVGLPESLGDLSSLQFLDIVRNSALVGLPESLGNLPSLESLVIHDNDSLVALPEGLGGLSTLRSLGIGKNGSLVGLPESLGSLSSLESLDVVDNGSLVGLPESLGELSNLRSLALYDNGSLVALPESLGNLASLQALGLARNGSLSGDVTFLGDLFDTVSFFDISSNGCLTASLAVSAELDSRAPNWRDGC